MNRRWWLRVVVPLVSAAVLVVVVRATGRDLNIGYLLAATLVFSAAGWLVADLLPRTAYSSWHVTASYTPRQPGTDLRLERFTDRLTSGVDREAVAFDVQRVLTEVVDDRLRRLHGVDRERQPEAAARLMGPELTDYLGTRPQLSRTGQAHQLASLLTRIEAL